MLKDDLRKLAMEYVGKETTAEEDYVLSILFSTLGFWESGWQYLKFIASFLVDLHKQEETSKAYQEWVNKG